MPGEVVPFGKYKGQPVEVLAADRDYCEWLLAQPWFAGRYGNVYNIVLNYGGEPQDSPEHNQMQALFLDDEWCLSLAALLVPEFADGTGSAAAHGKLRASAMCHEFARCLKTETVPAKIRRRQFEFGGWDVFFDATPLSINVHGPVRDRLPACICECDHGDCPQDSPCQGGSSRNVWCRHERHAAGRQRADLSASEFDHCTEGCPWGNGGPMRERVPDSDSLRFSPETKAGWLGYVARHGARFGLDYLPSFYVELKPDLGDDYPAVLRQVNGYHSSDGRRCVVARRYAFEAVTWEQVKKIFAASGVTLVAESEIKAAADPEKRVLALLERELGAEVIE